MTRPASIPEKVVPTVLSLSRQGFGVRRIDRALEGCGVWTTRSSVHRLLTGQPPYQNANVTESHDFEAGKP